MTDSIDDGAMGDFTKYIRSDYLNGKLQDKTELQIKNTCL